MFLFVFLKEESLLNSIELYSIMPLYQDNCPHLGCLMQLSSLSYLVLLYNFSFQHTVKLYFLFSTDCLQAHICWCMESPQSPVTPFQLGGKEQF